MQIPKDILSEKNYEGSRLISIDNQIVKELHAEKVKIMETEKKPILDEMTKLEGPLEVFYEQLRPLEIKREELKKEMKPLSDEYSAKVAEVEIVQQKIDLIDQKIATIVNDEVKPQLGEFEQARDLHTKDGKFDVEVVDLIEEKIKEVRANKK